jgi:hypothetical protein
MGVETVFEQSIAIDFIYGYPLILILALFLAWVTYKQFRLAGPSQRLKLNSAVFAGVWLISLTYVALFSYSLL